MKGLGFFAPGFIQFELFEQEIVEQKKRGNQKKRLIWSDTIASLVNAGNVFRACARIRIPNHGMKYSTVARFIFFSLSPWFSAEDLSPIVRLSGVGPRVPLLSCQIPFIITRSPQSVGAKGNMMITFNEWRCRHGKICQALSIQYTQKYRGQKSKR